MSGVKFRDYQNIIVDGLYPKSNMPCCIILPLPMSAPLLAAAPTGDTATIAPAISSAILDDAAGALPPPTAENAVPEWFAKAKATLMKVCHRKLIHASGP